MGKKIKGETEDGLPIFDSASFVDEAPELASDSFTEDGLPILKKKDLPSLKEQLLPPGKEQDVLLQNIRKSSPSKSSTSPSGSEVKQSSQGAQTTWGNDLSDVEEAFKTTRDAERDLHVNPTVVAPANLPMNDPKWKEKKLQEYNSIVSQRDALLKSKADILNQPVEEAISTGAYKSFIEPDGVINHKKVREYADAYAKETGAGSYVRDHISASLYKRIENEQIKPLVESEYKKELKKNGVDPEKYGKQVFDKLTEKQMGDADLANKEAQAVANEYQDKYKGLAELRSNEYTSFVANINDQFRSGKLSEEEANKQLAEAIETHKQDIADLNSEYQKEVKDLDKKTREKLQRINSEIKNIAGGITDEQVLKSIPEAERLAIEKSWQDAYANAQKSKGMVDKAVDSAYGVAMPGKFFVSGFNRGLSSVGEYMAKEGYDNGLANWLTDRKTYAERYKPADYRWGEDEWYKKAMQVTFENLGASLPVMLPAVGIGIASRGAALPVSVGLLGAASYKGEDIQIQGENYASKLAETGDVNKAISYSDEVSRDNRFTAPLHFVGGLGDAFLLRGAGSAKKLLLGTALEQVEEIPTEVMQGYNEAKNSGYKKGITEWVKENPEIIYDTFVATLGMSGTFATVGKAWSSMKESVPSGQTQQYSDMIQKLGVDGSKAVLEGWLKSGVINEETYQSQVKDLERINENLTKLDKLGVRGDAATLYVGLSDKVRSLETQAKEEQDPANKMVLEKQLSDTQKDLKGVVEGTSPYIVFGLAGGQNNTMAMTVDQFNRLPQEQQEKIITYSDGTQVIGDPEFDKFLKENKKQLGNPEGMMKGVYMNSEGEMYKPERSKERLKDTVKNVAVALSKIASGTKVEWLSDRMIQAKYKELDGQGTANAFYDPSTGTIYMNNEYWESNTGIHEGFHPIINALRRTNPDLYNSFADQASKAKHYSGKTYGEVMKTGDEALVEYLADIADSKYGEEVTLKEKAIRFVNQMLKSLGMNQYVMGMDVDTSTLSSLAKGLADAVRKGQAVNEFKQSSKTAPQANESGTATTPAVSPTIQPVTKGQEEQVAQEPVSGSVTPAEQGTTQESAAVLDQPTAEVTAEPTAQAEPTPATTPQKVAPISEATVEKSVEKTVEKEQAPERIAPTPAKTPKQIAREKIDALVESGDLSIDGSKVNIITQKGGDEFKKIKEEREAAEKNGVQAQATKLVDKDGNKLYTKGTSVPLERVVSNIDDTTFGPLYKWWKKNGSDLAMWGGRGDSEGIANFNGVDDRIRVNLNHSKFVEHFGSQNNIDRTMAHEVIHAIVKKHVGSKGPKYQAFDSELEGLRDILKAQDISGLDEYTQRMIRHIKGGAAEEMVTYALTDPKVAAYFSTIPVDETKSNSKTIWDKIKELILGVINSSPQKSLLDSVTDVLNKYTETFTDEVQAQEVKPGNRLFNKPLPEAKEIADRYYQRVFGEERPRFEGTKTLDVERAKRIADAFVAMKHDPTNPKVAEAYNAMVNETLEQYKDIAAQGYKVEVNNNEPYGNSQEMIDDLRDNKRLKIFSTESGFGDTPITSKQRKENPLLRDSGVKDVNGVPLLNNDIFRFVHDFFGHAELGNSFGPKGEENAWNVHARMFSPIARKAMTSETRGQNSYVNFSGVNEKIERMRDEARALRAEGKEAQAQKLVEKIYEVGSFADQKVGLLPDEFIQIDGVQAQRPKSQKALREEAKNVSDAMASKHPESVALEPALTKEGKIKTEQLLDDNGKKVGDPIIQYKKVPYNLLNGAKKYISSDVNKAKEKLASALVQDYKDNIGRTEISAAIGWYGKMRDWFQKNFGANIELFGQLLAATSARTGVKQNFEQAIEAMKLMSQGKYDDLLKEYHDYVTRVGTMTDANLLQEWKSKYPAKKESQFAKEKDDLRSKLINDFDKTPARANGKGFNINSPKVLQALYGNWLTQTYGPKTKNFAGNLTGRSYKATIDVWAARYMRKKIYDGKQAKWRILPQQEGGVTFSENVKGEMGGDYFFAEDVMQKAADQLGINADDLQAFLWYLEKDVWDKNGWTNKAGKEKSSFEDGAALLRTDRYQAGVTTSPSSPEDFEAARKELSDAIKSVDGVIVYRNNPSVGEYFGKDGIITEPSYDLEFTVNKGTDVSKIQDKIIEIGKRFGQESVMFSKVVGSDDINARAMIEIGLRVPSETSPAIDKAKQILSGLDVRGFTIAKDRNGKIIGVRSQFVPEFEGGTLEDGNRRFIEATKQLKSELANNDEISYIEQGFVDTKVNWTNEKGNQPGGTQEGSTGSREAGMAQGQTRKPGQGSLSDQDQQGRNNSGGSGEIVGDISGGVTQAQEAKPGSRKLNKTAARVQKDVTDQWQSVKASINSDQEPYKYDVRSINKMAEEFEAMSEPDLWNIWNTNKGIDQYGGMVGIKLIQKIEARGGDATGVFKDLWKLGSNSAFFVRTMAEMNTTTAAGIARVIQGNVQAGGLDLKDSDVKEITDLAKTYLDDVKEEEAARKEYTGEGPGLGEGQGPGLGQGLGAGQGPGLGAGNGPGNGGQSSQGSNTGQSGQQSGQGVSIGSGNTGNATQPGQAGATKGKGSSGAYKRYRKAQAKRANSQAALTAKAASVTPRGLDKLLLAILQGNVLGLPSVMANIYGNTIGAPARWLEDIGGSMAVQAMNAIHGQPTAGINPILWMNPWFRGIGGLAVGGKKGAKAMVYGTQQGNKLGDDRSLHPFDALVQLISRKGLPVDPKTGKVTWSTELEKSIEGLAGWNPELMFRLLELTDAPFRESRRKKAEYLVAIDNGAKSVAEAKLFIANMTKAQKAQVENIAQAGVFADDRTLSKSIQGLVKAIGNSVDVVNNNIPEQFTLFKNVLGAITKVTLRTPFLFTKIPANLTQLMIELRFPLVAWAGASKYAASAALNKSNPELAKANMRKAGELMTRGLVGVALNIAMDSLLAAGLLTAGTDDDKPDEKAAKYEGPQPNSINYSGLLRYHRGLDPSHQPGDHYMNFSRLGQLGMFMAVKAEEWENNGKKPHKDSASYLDASIRHVEPFLKGVSQAPFMEGAANVLGALENEKGLNYYASQTLGALSNIPNVGPVIPGVNPLATQNNNYATYVKTQAPYILKPGDKESVSQSIIEKISTRKNPLIENAEPGVVPARNIWGEKVPMTPEGSNPLVYHFLDIRKGRTIEDPWSIENFKQMVESPNRTPPITAPNNKVNYIAEKTREDFLYKTGGDYSVPDTYVDLIQAYAGKMKRQILADVYDTPEKMAEFQAKDNAVKWRIMNEINSAVNKSASLVLKKKVYDDIAAGKLIPDHEGKIMKEVVTQPYSDKAVEDILKQRLPEEDPEQD